MDSYDGGLHGDLKVLRGGSWTSFIELEHRHTIYDPRSKTSRDAPGQTSYNPACDRGFRSSYRKYVDTFSRLRRVPGETSALDGHTVYIEWQDLGFRVVEADVATNLTKP